MNNLGIGMRPQGMPGSPQMSAPGMGAAGNPGVHPGLLQMIAARRLQELLSNQRGRPKPLPAPRVPQAANIGLGGGAFAEDMEKFGGSLADIKKKLAQARMRNFISPGYT